MDERDVKKLMRKAGKGLPFKKIIEDSGLQVGKYVCPSLEGVNRNVMVSYWYAQAWGEWRRPVPDRMGRTLKELALKLGLVEYDVQMRVVE